MFSVLLGSAHHTMAYFYAPGTKANIKSHLRQWLHFCLRFDRAPFPATRDSLLAFAKLLSLTVSYGHIKNIFSSLKFTHHAIGETFPEHDFQVSTVLQSLKRELGNKPFQVLPITPEILVDLYTFIDIGKVNDLALWSAFLTAFYCLLRKSSVVPVSLAKFDPSKGLSRKKIKIVPSKNIALVYINFSKTIQFWTRDIVIPMVGHRIRALDPVFHLQRLFDTSDLPEHLPAFSYKETRIKTITYDTFTTRLKDLLTRAGYRAKDYAGHSFRYTCRMFCSCLMLNGRRGGASHLHKLGADSLTIQASGGNHCFLFLYNS